MTTPAEREPRPALEVARTQRDPAPLRAHRQVVARVAAGGVGRARDGLGGGAGAEEEAGAEGPLRCAAVEEVQPGEDGRVALAEQLDRSRARRRRAQLRDGRGRQRDDPRLELGDRLVTHRIAVDGRARIRRERRRGDLRVLGAARPGRGHHRHADSARDERCQRSGLPATPLHNHFTLPLGAAVGVAPASPSFAPFAPFPPLVPPGTGSHPLASSLATTARPTFTATPSIFAEKTTS